MRIRYISITTLLLFSFIVWFGGCKKNNPTEPGDGGNNGTTVTTTISGTVLDAYNEPISGATVTVAGQSKTSSSDGTFLFSGIAVPKDRFVVNVSKSNYFDGSVADVPKSGGVVNVKVYLVQGDEVKTVSAASGGSLSTSNGTGVELPANSVVKSDGSAFTGNVKMSVAYLDPTSENFSTQVPGGDLRAQRTDNSQTTLYSYGIIKVGLQNDSGDKLELKSGTQSKITVDIPPSMEGDAPSTIPLWHYDAASGLWKEEGTATKQGDKYVGYVSHFSDWNCDVPGGTATVKGLVVDCNGAPVGGMTVKIGQASKVTGSDGTFERRVPINVNFTVQVIGSKNFGLSSTPVTVNALTEGSVKDVGTLAVPCPAYVSGQIACSGTTKYGQIVVSWQGGYNTQYSESDGKFKIAVDIAKNAQLSINTFDGKYKTMPITTPSNRGDELKLGTIEVCDQVQLGDNQFTLNGDGFANRTFTFTSDTQQVFGYYAGDTSNTSYIGMAKVMGTDTIVCVIMFSGNTVGAASDVIMEVMYNSKIYFGYGGMPGTNVAVNVTKYQGIGGIIEGTFTGTLSAIYNGGATVNLTNGKFSVLRIIGTQMDKMKQKFPGISWNKLRR